MFVSKYNIPLHPNLFSNFNDAEHFAREWLLQNEIAQYDLPNRIGDKRTISNVKWYLRKGSYPNNKKIIAKVTYVVQCQYPNNLTYDITTEHSVIINMNNN